MEKWEEYIFQLNSSQCQCGKRKKPKISFCPNCFYRLPQQMRKDLYKKLWYGYGNIYDQAVKFLNNKPVNKDERERYRQTLHNIIDTIEDNKWTKLTFSVKYELWHEFKTYCHLHNINPHDSMTNHMRNLTKKP